MSRQLEPWAQAYTAGRLIAHVRRVTCSDIVGPKFIITSQLPFTTHPNDRGPMPEIQIFCYSPHV